MYCTVDMIIRQVQVVYLLQASLLESLSMISLTQKIESPIMITLSGLS